MNFSSVTAPRAAAVGLIVGGMAAAASLQPTISKRTKTEQLELIGASAAAGFGVGALAAKGLGALSGKVPGGAIAAFAGLAAGGLALHYGSHLGDPATSKVAAGAESAGTVATTIGAAGLAVLGARFVGPGAVKLLPAALSGGRIEGAVHALAGPAALAGGIGIAALAAHGKDSQPTQPPSRVVAVATAAAAKMSGTPGNSAVPPLLDSVSGSPASGITMESLGHHGVRFVHEAVPGEKIREVMGEGVDPIRVYAGLGTSSTPEGRVSAAMADLERLGAFDGSRRQIIVTTPTGSGFVDPPAIQAAEFMERGHTATVALQYSDKPSVQSTDKVPLAAEQTKLLIEAINARIAKMPADQRPQVNLFAESLGAWSQQENFEGKGNHSIDDLGVDHALWVGSPHESGFSHEAVAEAANDQLGTELNQFDRIEDVEGLSPAERQHLKYVMLTHQNDPVAHTDFATLAYQRPSFLPEDGDNPRGMPAGSQFIPGVSLGQGLIDLIHGTNPVPTEYGASSHDYRADLAEFARVAYGHDATGDATPVSDAQVQAINEQLLQMNKNRAAILERDPSW
jgi:uncharacterized membrane protein